MSSDAIEPSIFPDLRDKLRSSIETVRLSKEETDNWIKDSLSVHAPNHADFNLPANLQKSGGTLRTMKDLYSRQYGNFILPLTAFSSFLHKTEVPLTSATTAYWSKFYGPQVINLLNYESDILGILPKLPYIKSGFRIRTARGSNGGFTTEMGTIPDSEDATKAYATFAPKLIINSIAQSRMSQLLAETDDDTYDPSIMFEEIAMEQAKLINTALAMEFGTLASTSCESVDRFCSSSVERAACGEDDADEDLHGVDRSATTAFNAQVLHNSNVDRPLTDSLLHSALVQSERYTSKGAPRVWLTSEATAKVISDIYKNSAVFNYDGFITPSVNGIQVGNVNAPGAQAGFKVAQLYGYPVMTSSDITTDTIGRVYLLDLSTCGIRYLEAPTISVDGASQGRPLANNSISDKIVVHQMFEFVGENPAANVKIRDLAE